ncbi:MAG: permease-like cell division protein FtsX, partial [Lacticaseibacillus rhamnosus]|nr:permease-like cell division protein FtsX [Lacticaseibacillus rhamnosus]
MKSKVFFRHVKDSLRSLRRNGWMSVAAVSAVTVTLLLVGIFMALIFNLHHISQQVENDVQVRVYIDKKTTTKQRDDLKDKLKKLDHVNKVTYRSRQQELDTIIGGYGSQWRMFSGDQNPLSDVFMVKTNSPKATISVSKEAQKLDHVVDASYGGRTAKKLFNSVDVAQKWGLAFTILLLFVAVFL